MPAVRAYPGVYIEEIPSGVRTIVGVSTSITAFFGRAISGPVNQPVTINSYGDFERIFGGLWLKSTLGYAVRDFFLNGGSQAVIVRLFHPYLLTREDRAQALVYGGNISTAIAALASPTSAAVTTAMATTITAAGTKSAAVQQAVAVIVAWVNAAAAVTPLPTSAAMATALTAALPTLVQITKSSITVKTLNDVPAAAADVILEAKNEGAYTANLRFVVTKVDADILPSVKARYGLGDNDWSNVTIFDGNTQVEKFFNVSLKSSERQLDKVLENESAWLRVISTLPTADSHLDPSTSYNPYTVTQTAVDGDDLDTNDVQGSAANKTGLYALDNADLINLLCIPPLTRGVALSTGLVSSAIVYCQSRRAMMLVDPPWDSVADALAGIDSTVGDASKNAAVFFPKLRQPNPLRDNQLEDFVPCGAVAGVIARTDATRGVWKAPAGLDAALNGVPQLKVDINDQESGQLNQKGINALRSMPGAGRVIWGARTRVGADRLASEWKYLSVRRLALYIEESLFRGTQWAVFQPNDEPLWAQLRLNVGTFMQDLFRQGAFKGQTVQEAYFVRCDRSTTTQSDINQGVVNVVVGFAPLKPAEFVIITLQQLAGQS